MIGDIVYFADLGNKRTFGLGARTGRKVFEHERGSYNPVVSDGETIYLTGYHAMYALQPLTAAGQAASAKAREARGARRPNDRQVCAQARADAHRGTAARSAARRALRGAQAGAAPRGGSGASASSGRARCTAAARAGSSAPTSNCVIGARRGSAAASA